MNNKQKTEQFIKQLNENCKPRQVKGKWVMPIENFYVLTFKDDLERAMTAREVAMEYWKDFRKNSIEYFKAGLNDPERSQSKALATYWYSRGLAAK